MISKDSDLYKNLVTFYKFRGSIDKFTIESFRENQNVKGKFFKCLLYHAYNAGYTNIAYDLSPLAIVEMLHARWIEIQGIDKKFAVGTVLGTKGFDDKFPQDLLELFEDAWLEAFPDSTIIKCEVRPNNDFKDVIYYYPEDIFKDEVYD